PAGPAAELGRSAPPREVLMRWRLAPMAFAAAVVGSGLGVAAVAALLCRLLGAGLSWWYFLGGGTVLGAAGLWFDRWLSRVPWTSRWHRLSSVLFFPAGVLWALFDVVDQWVEQRAWPRTVEQAVERLLRMLDRESRCRLQSLNEDTLAVIV